MKALPQLGADPGDVLADHGLDEGVSDRGAGPLVLAPNRRHLMRCRHDGVWSDRADEGCDAPLVIGAQIGEQAADRDDGRLFASVREPSSDRLQTRLVKRLDLAAVVIDPAAHADAVTSPDKRTGAA